MIAADPTGAYLVSVTEFGRRIGVGRSKAYELTQAGEVRTVRIGARVLVPVAEVERFVHELLEEGPT